MSAHDDGGPAFPSAPMVGPAGDLYRPADIGCSGASLRDYFAARVMEAQIVKLYGCSFFDEGGCTYAKIALESYLMADAMLKQRIAS